MKFNKKSAFGLAGLGAVIAGLGIASLLKKDSDVDECEAVEEIGEIEATEVDNIEQAE